MRATAPTEASGRPVRARSPLCGRGAAHAQRLASRTGAAPAQALERQRTTTVPGAAQPRSQAGLGQGARRTPARRGVAHRPMARGKQRRDSQYLVGSASPSGHSPCRPRHRSNAWSRRPSCGGVSNETTGTSSRSLAWAITRDEDGAASTTMPASASPPTDSSSPSAGRLPPRLRLPPKAARRLAFPVVDDPAAPPARPERHVPTSIATLRRRLTLALVQRLSRCPCCNQTGPNHHPTL